MPKMIKKRNSKTEGGLTIKFDIVTLNSIIKYTLCEFVTHGQLSNLIKLLDKIDISTYNYSPDIQIRIRLIKVLCDAVVTNKLSDLEIIQSYICQREPDVIDIVKEIGLVKNSINSSECRYLSQAINERLQFGYIYNVKDELISSLEKLDENGFNVSYYNIITDIKLRLTNLMANLQNSGASDSLIRSFNFSNDQFAHLIDTIIQKSKRPSSILQTGIRQLNAMLSPGFQSGRLYTFIGGTGKFKSGTLLNVADQIRRYNPQITPIENGLRKTILYITCENSIHETVERLFDMYSDVDDRLSDKTPEEVIRILRDEGGFKYTDNEGIDIDMKYYGNLELKTTDIYAIVQDLENNGKKVIGIILDYLKRIDSARENNNDERIRMSYVAKELKTIAQFLEIPIITAMQLNREGNGILDAAMRDNKQDVASFVGTSNIGKLIQLIADLKPFELRGRTRYVA